MLEPKIKKIVSSFVGQEQGVYLVKEYDKKYLYPMLVKCYEYLHPLIRSNGPSILRCPFFGVTRAIAGGGVVVVPLSLVQYMLGYDWKSTLV